MVEKTLEEFKVEAKEIIEKANKVIVLTDTNNAWFISGDFLIPATFALFDILVKQGATNEQLQSILAEYIKQKEEKNEKK